MKTVEDFNAEMKALYYPSKADFTKYNVYKRGKVLCHDASEDVLLAFVKMCVENISDKQLTLKSALVELESRKYVVEKVFYDCAYNDKVRAYHEGSNKITAQFEQYLYQLHGVEDNAKRELCFSKAWSMGHSSGFSEVESYFGELVDLIT